MTAKAHKHWFIAIGGIIATAALLLHYKERDSYRCQSYWALKNVFQWRLGSWSGFSIPLTPQWEQVSETRIQHDFFPAGHTHEWAFAQGSPYQFFGTVWGGCAIGVGRHVSELSQLYESSPEFRAFISQRLDEGTLTKSNIITMMSPPRSGKPSPTKQEADALLETFFVQLPW
jgi:hypothetical protein